MLDKLGYQFFDEATMEEKQKSPGNARGEVVVDIKGGQDHITLSSILSRQNISSSSRLDNEVDVISVEYRDDPSNGGDKNQTDGLKKRKSTLGDVNRVATLQRSTFSKPKSRFIETRTTTTMNSRRIAEESKSKGTPTPKAVDEEEDDPFKSEDIPHDLKTSTVSIWVVLEWIAFIVLAALMICSITVKGLENHVLWGLEMWKWCVMVMVVFCGRLVSGWFISLLVFLIERNFMLRKRVLYFVYGLRKSVKHCIWLALAIAAWFVLFDPRVEHSTKNHKTLEYVTRALIALLVASVIWLLKTLAIKVMASRFHVKNFFERIQESIFSQYVLEALSGPPLMEEDEEFPDQISKAKRGSFLCGRIRFKRKDSSESELDLEHLQKLNTKNVSAWNMKRLIQNVRDSKLSTLSNAIDQTVETEITGEIEAKAAAKDIFRNVAKPAAKFIEKEDLLRFLKSKEVDEVFPKFEGAAETGKIKKASLKNWVMNVYVERRALGHALNDTKTVVKELNQIVNVLVSILIAVIIVLILGIASTHVIVLITSQLVLVAFIFGNSCKTMFEAIIFVFVMHPFDVGDRCVVDGVQMVVEEMNILTTTFLRFDNEKIFYPNSTLSTKPISNFYRSPEMGDSVEFSLDATTSMEQIGALREGIAKYIESKAHFWIPKHTVAVKEIENMNRMKMALYVTHTINHQNIGEKTNRKTDLVLELKKLFERLEIKYHLLPQDLNVNIMRP